MDRIQKQKEAVDMKARSLRLEDLVNIQDGAIVSREMISQKTGTVTAFAFDEGQQLSEHTAPFDAMVIGIGGEAKITIDGTPHVLKKDEMIIMPAGIPHALLAVTQFKMLLVMIKK